MCDKFDRILIHDPMLQLLRDDVFCACSSAVGIWGRMDANYSKVFNSIVNIIATMLPLTHVNSWSLRENYPLIC